MNTLKVSNLIVISTSLCYDHTLLIISEFFPDGFVVHFASYQVENAARTDPHRYFKVTHTSISLTFEETLYEGQTFFTVCPKSDLQITPVNQRPSIPVINLTRNAPRILCYVYVVTLPVTFRILYRIPR